MEPHAMCKLIEKAVRDARPISEDLSSDGVRAAHHALDIFVHNFVDSMQNHVPPFSRQYFCEATKTPFNRFER